MPRHRDVHEPTWIDFPPRWPARGGATGDAEHERPPVVLTAAIPHRGRRERPVVLRIVTGVRPPLRRAAPSSR